MKKDLKNTAHTLVSNNHTETMRSVVYLYIRTTVLAQAKQNCANSSLLLVSSVY